MPALLISLRQLQLIKLSAELFFSREIRKTFIGKSLFINNFFSPRKLSCTLWKKSLSQRTGMWIEIYKLIICEKNVSGALSLVFGSKWET